MTLLAALLLAASPAVAAAAPLAAAARHGHVAALELGLSLGLPVDGVDHAGLTPLHHAAANGQLEVARILVAHGASREIRDPRFGGTALGHARFHAERWPRPGCSAIVALLE